MSGRFVRRICRRSEVYDSAHAAEVGYNCPHRHTKYYWKGVEDSNYTVIGDSLLKAVRGFKYTDIQCIPGATLYGLTVDILVKQRISLSYETIIIACGTNDISNGFTESEFVDGIDNLVSVVLGENPQAKIGIASILPRPCDGYEGNLKVRNYNRALTRYCNSKRRKDNQKIWFCQTYRKFLEPVEPHAPILSRFASDKLHLSLEGSQYLKEALEGHIKRLIGY